MSIFKQKHNFDDDNVNLLIIGINSVVKPNMDYVVTYNML